MHVCRHATSKNSLCILSEHSETVNTYWSNRIGCQCHLKMTHIICHQWLKPTWEGFKRFWLLNPTQGHSKINRLKATQFILFHQDCLICLQIKKMYATQYTMPLIWRPLSLNPPHPVFENKPCRLYEFSGAVRSGFLRQSSQMNRVKHTLKNLSPVWRCNHSDGGCGNSASSRCDGE